MNSKSCDRCGDGTTLEFDFCWHCGADLCPDCLRRGCCGKAPAASGTAVANGLYLAFGVAPPDAARGRLDP